MKRILNIFLCCTLLLGIFPQSVKAVQTDAFDLYQQATEVTMRSGNWREECVMTANMKLSNGSNKIKTKTTMNFQLDVSNYDKDAPNDIQISGSADMSIMGQTYAWDILYKDGVAHYEYKAPIQTEADMRIDPICFDLDSFTSDMLKNEKIDGNRISFTIPSNKMQYAEINAVQLIEGIENLRYGDMEVEIELDSMTGAIDNMHMTVHAEMRYQGYDSEVDYEIDYRYRTVGTDNNIFGMKNGLFVCSNYSNLSIPANDMIILAVGIVKDEKQLEDVSGITFWVEDTSVLQLLDTEIQDNLRYVRWKGVQEGETTVVFTDSQTGYTIKIPVTVYKRNSHSYTLFSVPEKQIVKNHLTNFYNVNGLYIDNYKYTINDDKTANVSFDVYNTNQTYAAVEVYDENGKMKDAVLIEKMKLKNESIKESVWDNSLSLIKDIWNGNLFSYRQESGYSKHTPVSVKIPKDGYIKICTDPENSVLVSLVNGADILLSAASFVEDFSEYDINSKDFTDKLTKKILTDQAYAYSLKDENNFSKKLCENLSKEVIFSSEGLGTFCDTFVNNLNNLELEDLLVETTADLGWDIGEDVFVDFSGFIGKLLKGMFLFAKAGNVFLQYDDFVKLSDTTSIYIQNQSGEVRTSQQIKLENESGFTDETALNVFTVKIDDDLLNMIKKVNPDIYEAIQNGITYNISLLENGQEVQPNGEVTVYIPIPEEMKALAYIGQIDIYRVENDGTLSKMDVELEDGCFVFTTDHFSLYTLAAGKVPIVPIMLIGITVIIILITMYRVRKRKALFA